MKDGWRSVKLCDAVSKRDESQRCSLRQPAGNDLPALCAQAPPADRGGSDPSSGPRRLVTAPVAVHLLPWEKEKEYLFLRRPAAYFRARRALSPAGAGRVKGYFLPFFTTPPMASRTFRTNSSRCSSTSAFGMRSSRTPRVRKRSCFAATLRIWLICA